MEATGDYGDSNAFGKSTSNVPGDGVKIDDLVAFLFPENLQHPLVAGRLIVYGLYGPLDDQLRLRTGPKKRNVVSDWQLDLMCIQVEREDILCVYLHEKAEMVLLQCTNHSLKKICSYLISDCVRFSRSSRKPKKKLLFPRRTNISSQRKDALCCRCCPGKT